MQIPGYSVRPALERDLDACNRLCAHVHGHDRHGELLDAIRQGSATLVEHAGRITGYATSIAFFGHAVGETNSELKALIGAAPAFPGPGFLLPTRNAELFRWCLDHGLRVVQPMTLMSIGSTTNPLAVSCPLSSTEPRSEIEPGGVDAPKPQGGISPRSIRLQTIEVPREPSQ